MHRLNLCSVALGLSGNGPNKVTYWNCPLVWDTGASFGLTPFCGDFIDYVECWIAMNTVVNILKYLPIFLWTIFRICKPKEALVLSKWIDVIMAKCIGSLPLLMQGNFVINSRPMDAIELGRCTAKSSGKMLECLTIICSDCTNRVWEKFCQHFTELSRLWISFIFPYIFRTREQMVDCYANERSWQINTR